VRERYTYLPYVFIIWQQQWEKSASLCRCAQSFNHRLAIPCGDTFLHSPVLSLPPPRAILSGFPWREQRFLISMVRCWWKISLDISCWIEAFHTRAVYLPPIYARNRRHRLLNRSFEELLRLSLRPSIILVFFENR